MKFDPREHSRSRDPGTSKTAAAKVAVRAISHASQILSSLQNDGPGTFAQIAGRCGLTEAQVWRRLPDLQKAGAASPTDEIIEGRRVWVAGSQPAPAIQSDLF